MDDPKLLDLDIASAPGRRLLAAVEARHGSNIVAMARVPERMFALSSPWAPGLRVVGAEARGGGQLYSLAGTGLELADALASCLGEGAERLSQIECAGDVAVQAPVTMRGNRQWPAATRLIAALASHTGMAPVASTEVDWVAGSDLGTGREILLPADWVLRRVTPGPLTLPNAASSTGAAAGPTAEAAAVRALLELVERDAAALWWIGGRRGRPVAMDAPAAASATALLDRLRLGDAKRATWYLDLTTDLAIPTVAALSVSPNGDQFACGLAARLSVEDAVRAATFELCQMELGLQVIALKSRQRGDAALNDADRRQLTRATSINAATCELLHPLGLPQRPIRGPCLDDATAVSTIQAAFADRSIDAALVELTRPEFAIPVIVAAAPDLQRLPCDVITPRLAAAIAAHGGGGRWTGGVAIV